MDVSCIDLNYDALFREFPRQRLSKWELFIFAHFADEDHPIQTLQAFYEQFNVILDVFRTNNFVEQYTQTCKDDAEFQANHTSVYECEANLAGLRDAIGSLTAAGVESELDYIYWLHRNCDYRSLSVHAHSPLERDIWTLLVYYRSRVALSNIDVNTPPRDPDPRNEHRRVVPRGPQPTAERGKRTRSRTSPTSPKNPWMPRGDMRVSALLTKMQKF